MKCNNIVIAGNTFLRQTVFQYELDTITKEILFNQFIINNSLYIEVTPSFNEYD